MSLQGQGLYVSTSLPPRVDGVIVGELHVKVQGIKWSHLAWTSPFPAKSQVVLLLLVGVGSLVLDRSFATFRCLVFVLCSLFFVLWSLVWSSVFGLWFLVLVWIALFCLVFVLWSLSLVSGLWSSVFGPWFLVLGRN